MPVHHEHARHRVNRQKIVAGGQAYRKGTCPTTGFEWDVLNEHFHEEKPKSNQDNTEQLGLNIHIADRFKTQHSSHTAANKK